MQRKRRELKNPDKKRVINLEKHLKHEFFGIKRLREAQVADDEEALRHDLHGKNMEKEVHDISKTLKLEKPYLVYANRTKGEAFIVKMKKSDSHYGLPIKKFECVSSFKTEEDAKEYIKEKKYKKISPK